MSTPALYIFDDGRARRWAPFSLTRPIAEISFGCGLLRTRTESALGLECAGHLSRSALAGFKEAGSPPVVSTEEVNTESGVVLISSRVVLTAPVDAIREGPSRIEVAGVTVGWVIPPGGDTPSDLWLRDPATAPRDGESLSWEGALLAHPWDLVEHNPDAISADIAALGATSPAPLGIVMIGDGGLSIAESAVIEPGVVLDTRAGPIRLADSVRVEGPARLVGPLAVGEGTILLGGSIGGSSIGRDCKVRGELWGSLLGDRVNKAHEGHIGRAVIGAWVNLGAGTTNSDLKNNYGTVTVWTPDGDVDTGRIKVGCFLGDHVKTGIGTLLNTGTVIGAGSNVFGGAMPPTAVPPFSWGSGANLTTHKIERFLETTERVMSRRSLELDDSMKALFKRAWSVTATQRPE